MYNEPIVIKFTTTSADCDLFTLPNIVDQLTKRFGDTIINRINECSAGMMITVFVDSVTQIKLHDEDNYNDFIADTVFSTGTKVFVKHCYIKGNGVSGTLSVQIV